MSRWKPNVRFDHAFAIVRVDGFQRNLDFETALDSTITVRKIVWDQETAESEVARLNRLNKDKGLYISGLSLG